MRCPACNANRTVSANLGTWKSGTICTVCGASWCGDLYSNKEMEQFKWTVEDLVPA